MMRSRFRSLALALAAMVLTAGLTVAQCNPKSGCGPQSSGCNPKSGCNPNAGMKSGSGKKKTLTGVVSDAMCGAKHMMAGNDAECTRACVKKGSKYALVVGDKVYTLNGGPTDELDKLAGQKAKINGTVSGDTVEVASVTPAKTS